MLKLPHTFHEPLTRYVKLRAAHASGMPGTFSRHRLQRKPLAYDPCLHHPCAWRTCRVACRSGRKNVPGIPGTCATRNFTYLARGPCEWNTKMETATAFEISSTILKEIWDPTVRPGVQFNAWTVFPAIERSIIKIERSWDRFIFIMEISNIRHRHIENG